MQGLVLIYNVLKKPKAVADCVEVRLIEAESR